MNFLHFGIIFVLLFNQGRCKPDIKANEDYDPDMTGEDSEMQNDDYDGEYNDTVDDNEKKDISNLVPRVTSKPEEFIVELHKEVRLPCDTVDAANFVLFWYKDNLLLFQDKLALGMYGNYYSVEKESNSLIIKNFTENEAGKYSCVIFTEQKIKPNITHEVYPPTSPKIEYLKADHDIVQLEAGKTLILTCKANGHPKPVITWHKDADRIGTQGETLTIENLTHKDSGYYRCLADNSIGNPAHTSIHISITHKPVVKIEKVTVNTAENYDTELICNIHAVPLAAVNWKKDGKNVVPDNERIFLKGANHSHILLIKGVKASDFGEYTCSAANYLGTTERVVSLIATPNVIKFIKPRQGKDVVLSWEVESHLPILEHQLEFRKAGHEGWKQETPEVKEAINDSKNLYIAEYIIKGLEPGNYEARLRSRNEYGWSKFSEITPFEGVSRKHGPHFKPHHKKHHKTQNGVEQNTPANEELGNNVNEDNHNKQQDQQESSYSVQSKETSGSATLVPTLTLTLVNVIFALLYRQQQ